MNKEQVAIIKKANKEVWGTNPAGWTHAIDKEKGTVDFFEQVLTKRFTEECPWLVELVKFESYAHKSVLEIGCGAGYDAYMFCSQKAEYTGIDLVPQNIQLTNQHLSLYGYAPTICELDAEEMDFFEQFDLIYSFGVLHHIPQIEKVLSNSYKALKADGEGVFIVYYKYSMVYYRIILHWIFRGNFIKESLDQALSRIEDVGSSERPFVQVYSKNKFEKMLTTAGFSVISCEVKKFNRDDLPRVPLIKYVYKYIPDAVFEKCAFLCGWYLCVKAKKNRSNFTAS